MGGEGARHDGGGSRRALFSKTGRWQGGECEASGSRDACAADCMGAACAGGDGDLRDLAPCRARLTAAASSATVVPSHTPGVAVAGTRIVDTRTGSAITLVGASRSGLEYSCTGDGHFQPADFAAMRAWGMNVVRLTLSSELRANHAG